jgi:hypothetical protein
MKSNKTFFLLLFMAVYGGAFSQTNSVQFSVSTTFGATPLDLVDSAFTTNDSKHLKITEVKFYLSKIQLLRNGKIVLEEKNGFHLVDAGQTNPFIIVVNNTQNISFDQVQFNLGIDSTTNVSGAMGGDLDPTKGMYWTWQSGYINFKLEGTSPLCTTRNNEFQFHLGGYQKPNYCLQPLSFPIKNSSKIDLNLDVQKILEQVDLSKTNHIMSPSAEAVLISKVVANAFTISKN